MPGPVHCLSWEKLFFSLVSHDVTLFSLQGRSKGRNKKKSTAPFPRFSCQCQNQNTSPPLCVNHQLVFPCFLSLGTWRSSFRWPTFKCPNPLGSWCETSQRRSLRLATLESLEPARGASSCSNVLGTNQLKPSSTDSDGTRCTASWSFKTMIVFSRQIDIVGDLRSPTNPQRRIFISVYMRESSKSMFPHFCANFDHNPSQRSHASNRGIHPKHCHGAVGECLEGSWSFLLELDRGSWCLCPPVWRSA